MDLVKATFSDDSDVYNRFLDTMREFKANGINTRQVIDTVSSLFIDYPDLLTGFNTFLPPGFHIRVVPGVGHTGRNRVQIITPNGTTVPQPLQPAQLSSLLTNHAYHSQGYPPLPQTAPHLPPNPPIFQPILGTGAVSSEPIRHQPPPPPPPPPPPADVDFHDAINYVNEIKNHYSQRPEVYRSFLDILHSYQREQHTIDEVYDQLRGLFQDAPHLLQGFQMFLPTISGASAPSVHDHRVAAPPRAPAYPASSQMTPPVLPSTSVRQPVHASGPAIDTRLPPVGTFPVTASQETAPSLPAHVTPSKKRNIADKKPRINGDKNNNVAIRNLEHDVLPSHTKQQRATKVSLKQETQPSNPISPAPSIEYIDQAQSLVTENDSFVLFNVQKHLQKTGEFENFIKVLDLFQLGCIDIELALQWVRPLFYKKSKLFEALCLVYNQSAPKQIPTRSILDLYAKPVHVFEDVSPSYKRLPKYLRNFASSGKTDLCHEVLNTLYVCPAKETRDLYRSTPPPKNDAEAKLEDLEERRYYFDTEIQCLSYVIKILTPISHQISSLPSDQLPKFRLAQAIGDRSISLIRKAIKSIYGVENFSQTMKAIDLTPRLALPRIIQRMKEKEHDWRVAAKEYELAHMRADAYFYPLSLDRQSSRFKPYDLKHTNRTSFIQEIKQAYNERSQVRESERANSIKYQIESALENPHIHSDVGKLFFIHLQTSEKLEHGQKLKAVEFFKILFGSLFNIKPFENIETNSDEQTSAKSCKNVNGDLTDKDQALSSKSSSANEPNPTLRQNLNFVPDNVYGIFADSTIYTIIRLYNLVYDRLKLIYSIALAKKYPSEPGPIRKLNHILDGGNSNKTIENYYETFLNRVQLWLEDQTPTNEFEFDMRNLLGPEIYVIFTLKSVFNFMIKYIQRAMKTKSSESLFFLFASQISTNRPFSVLDWWVYQLKSDLIAKGDKELIWIRYENKSNHLGYKLIHDREEFILNNILTCPEKSVSQIKNWVANEIKFKNTPFSVTEGEEKDSNSQPNSSVQQHLPFLMRNLSNTGSRKRSCTESDLKLNDQPHPKEEVLVERKNTNSTKTNEDGRKKRKVRWQGWVNAEERFENQDPLASIKESDTTEPNQSVATIEQSKE
jgi:histone deacetylase complex regulatory component SIN3